MISVLLQQSVQVYKRNTQTHRGFAQWQVMGITVTVCIQFCHRNPNDAGESYCIWPRMKRTPQVKVIRRALDLSQEEFAERFRIPLGTLRDWEQGRKDPTPPPAPTLL
jgi:hypothetical protein